MPSPTDKIYLFEYDERFEKLVATPDKYVKYDYNMPLLFPAALRGAIDRVLADPPFLSEECLTRTAFTMKSLLKDQNASDIIVCTGSKMEELLLELFPALTRVDFEPKHKGGLANSFACFRNY